MRRLFIIAADNHLSFLSLFLTRYQSVSQSGWQQFSADRRGSLDYAISMAKTSDSTRGKVIDDGTFEQFFIFSRLLAACEMNGRKGERRKSRRLARWFSQLVWGHSGCYISQLASSSGARPMQASRDIWRA